MGRLVKRFGGVVPSKILDARADADGIVRAARTEADQLLATARDQAETIRAEARRSGESEGRADAEHAFTALLLAARADAEKTRAAALPVARTLAMRMAEKIVGHAAQVGPEALLHIAAEALAATRASAGVVLLRVHPDDLTALEHARPVLLARVAAASADVRLLADASVGRAGCVVETAVGRLDARLQTQLAVLEKALFGDVAGSLEQAPHG